MRIVISALAVAVAGSTIGLWARWLMHRRGVWRIRLADNIPVNSKYWRERKKEPGEILYVAIGDSAAQGIGASRPNHSYVGVLATSIRSRTDRTLRVANLGISGATLRLAIDSELPQLAKLTPDIVTVCIGANDIADFDESRFEREIAMLLDAVPKHAIVADLPSFYFLPGQKKARIANRMLRAAAAERGLTVVDLHKLTDRQGLWGITTQFAGDLFHPNDRGYRIWAAALEPAVARRLAEL
ncbi:MAG: SGNH/GDSL hydrolase family protein [Kineosporiaceae bacterium]|nr:SGNH/GDSL hydrolase family protein [Aeromicrobium sp.]